MADAGGAAARVRVTIAWSPAPRQVWEKDLELPEATTALEALRASGLFEAWPELAGRPLDLSVWGRATGPSQALRDRDRLEVLRPLKVDPKVARRERFRKQGARTAGLFSKQPGKR